MMKIVVFVLALCATSLCFAQANLWSENFTGKTIGATSGTATGTPGGTWSVTTTPSGSFAIEDIPLISRGFIIDDTNTEGVWKTNNFSIAATGMATVTINLYTFGTNTSDYVRVYYSADGGPEILFAEMVGQALNGSATGSAIVSGNNLQIIVRGRDTNPGSFFAPFAFYFDDLSVTSVPVLYSCATANWGVASTWSTVGFTGPCDAVVPPTLSQVAIIGGGFRVDLPADANVGGVDVRATGTLRYTAANVDLGIDMGMFRVRSGGTVNSNGQTDAQIDFRENVSGGGVQVDIGGTLTIDDITFINNANTLHYLLGGGSLSIVDDVILSVNGTTLVNDMTSTLTVGDQINIASNATVNNNHTSTAGGVTFGGTGTFNNNQNLTVTNNITYTAAGRFNNNATVSATQLLFDTDNANFFNNSFYSGDITCADNGDDNNTFTNAAAAIATLGTINPNNGDLVISNSGTINQSGNFITTPATANFQNNASGVWNWSLTPNSTFDTNVAAALDCSTAGNTFNYNGAGVQRIIPTAYSNLVLSNSGVKDANNASWSVNGNWTLSNPATFLEGTGTVTFNGSGTQTIANATDNSFYGLTINTGATNTVQLQNDITVSNLLTLTRGGLDLNSKTLNITRNSAAALSRTTGYVKSETSLAPYSPMVWTIGTATGSFLFPFGKDNANYIPLTYNITTAGAGPGQVSIVTFPTLTNNTPFPTGVTHVKNAAGVDQSTNVADRFWIITPSAFTTAPTTSVTFTVASTERVASNPTLRAQRWSVNQWVTPIAPSAATSSAVTLAVPVAQMVPSAWTLVRNTITLPIELIDFFAIQSDKQVNLSWATASELNNDFFEVQRLTSNEEKFSSIETIKGSGTSTKQNDYSTTDYHPATGKNYYRLKQTDFDGTSTYSEVKMVEFTGKGSDMGVYPNPAKQDGFSVDLHNLKPGQKVSLHLTNILGIPVYQSVIEANEKGVIETTVPTSSLHGPFVLIVRSDKELRSKVIIE